MRVRQFLYKLHRFIWIGNRPLAAELASCRLPEFLGDRKMEASDWDALYVHPLDGVLQTVIPRGLCDPGAHGFEHFGFFCKLSRQVNTQCALFNLSTVEPRGALSGSIPPIARAVRRETSATQMCGGVYALGLEAAMCGTWIADVEA
jgi:hypothetical protein